MYRNHQSFLQYAPGFLVSEEEYNGENCNPADAKYPETCSTDPEVDRRWKEALYCGWRNGYIPYHITTQGMMRAELYVESIGRAHDIDEVTCITTTMLAKNGISACQIYYDNLFIVYSNDFELSHTFEELKQSIGKAVKARFANFDFERDCAHLWDSLSYHHHLVDN